MLERPGLVEVDDSLAVVVEFGDGTRSASSASSSIYHRCSCRRPRKSSGARSAPSPRARRRSSSRARDEVANAEKATASVEAAFVSTPVSVVGDFRAPPPDSGAIGIL